MEDNNPEYAANNESYFYGAKKWRTMEIDGQILWAQERDRRHAEITLMLEQMFVGEFFLDKEPASINPKMSWHLRRQSRYAYAYHFVDIDKGFLSDVVWKCVSEYVYKHKGRCSARWDRSDNPRVAGEVYITWMPTWVPEESEAYYWEGSGG